jgi:hypothetical protein
VNQEPKIVSFVLRFVYEKPPHRPDGLADGWYSVVRHVQSDHERRFAHWEDIVTFIQQYVDLSNDAKDE